MINVFQMISSVRQSPISMNSKVVFLLRNLPAALNEIIHCNFIYIECFQMHTLRRPNLRQLPTRQLPTWTVAQRQLPNVNDICSTRHLPNTTLAHPTLAHPTLAHQDDSCPPDSCPPDSCPPDYQIFDGRITNTLNN